MITARVFCIPKGHYRLLTEIAYTYPYQRMRVITKPNGTVIVVVYPEIEETHFCLLEHMTIAGPVH